MRCVEQLFSADAAIVLRATYLCVSASWLRSDFCVLRSSFLFLLFFVVDQIEKPLISVFILFVVQ